MKPVWIDSSSFLPEEYKEVLIWSPIYRKESKDSGVYQIAHINEDGLWWADDNEELSLDQVSHWANLIKPPKGFEL